MREGEERKAPPRASAAAARDNTWRPLASFPTPPKQDIPPSETP